MFCSGILSGVSYLYSKVELVNAFRINSSLKWSKLYSNRVSNIISECSKLTDADLLINNSLKWSKLYSNRVSNIISECSKLTDADLLAIHQIGRKDENKSQH
jgi:archaellum biogenesis ATPase FlaH